MSDSARDTGRKAATTMELSKRVCDTVDLVVQGFTLRAIADRHKIDWRQARADYLTGVQLLADRSLEATLALRDEVTMRQRVLIASNMPRARAGDLKAAMIVQRADDILISIHGLRSIKVDMPEPDPDPLIAEAMEAYLEGVADKIEKIRH